MTCTTDKPTTTVCHSAYFLLTKYRYFDVPHIFDMGVHISWPKLIWQAVLYFSFLVVPVPNVYFYPFRKQSKVT
jgi:hypothetical protein